MSGKLCNSAIHQHNANGRLVRIGGRAGFKVEQPPDGPHYKCDERQLLISGRQAPRREQGEWKAPAEKPLSPPIFGRS